MSDQFTHLDAKGNPSMVDVGSKQVSRREARAQSTLVLGDEIMSLLEGDELHTKKGPVFQTAILAGIMAAKRTSELIPLCHPLMLTKVKVEFEPIAQHNKVRIVSTCKLAGQTGVEMEALTAVSVAALVQRDAPKNDCSRVSGSGTVLFSL